VSVGFPDIHGKFHPANKSAGGVSLAGSGAGAVLAKACFM
jgi:hypothetical protein